MHHSAPATGTRRLVWMGLWTLCALFVVGCWFRGPRIKTDHGASAAHEPRSNILRADYVGSERCRFCHSEVFAAWDSSPMHRMTRVPENTDLRAPFDGRSWTFKQDRVRFETHGVHRFMRIWSADFGDHLYRVTRVIGGRYREDFAGVEVQDTRPGAPVQGNPRDELILPASYVFHTESFRLKGYSVMVTERPGLRAGGVWNQTCVACHNTVPHFVTLWGALAGPGAPGYQGQTVDRMLPPERRFTWHIDDETSLLAALADEREFMGTTPSSTRDLKRALRETIVAAREHMNADHFVELGIGCESCHGGSREHVVDPRILPSYQPRSPFLQLQPPPQNRAVTRAHWINRSCARCHQVLFSRYPHTWEGGQRKRTMALDDDDHPSGGSHINSGEARDFLLGGCAQQMSCTACHDPHVADRREILDRLATPAGNGTCTVCHPALATPAALQTHAHHDPNGAGGSCVACHMPRKNMGLDSQLTRYHRIGSPTDRARVEDDRPLECALCHPQATTRSLLGSIENWWGKRYDRSKLKAAYGDLNDNHLMATLRRGKPHEQVVAATTLAEHGIQEAAPLVARQLTHRIPLVRHHAWQAMQRLVPGLCTVDLDRDTAALDQQVEGCLVKLRGKAAQTAAMPP